MFKEWLSYAWHVTGTVKVTNFEEADRYVFGRNVESL